jgi:hypothetical protein
VIHDLGDAQIVQHRVVVCRIGQQHVVEGDAHILRRAVATKMPPFTALAPAGSVCVRIVVHTPALRRSKRSCVPTRRARRIAVAPVDACVTSVVIDPLVSRFTANVVTAIESERISNRQAALDHFDIQPSHERAGAPRLEREIALQ